MNRRDFLAVGASGAVGAAIGDPGTRESTGSPAPQSTAAGVPRPGSAEMRAHFPRLDREVFLDAAGGTPLGAFAEAGLRRYEEVIRYGRGDGRGAWFADMMDESRAGLARLLGVDVGEIAFVQSTKAGEQIVIDGMPGLREGGNLVTNDLHFAGSLHNLEGLRRTGVDVRIVRSRDWATDLESMAAAIDDDTELVSITLLSNVNGHIEPVREIADLAHAHGALVYADVIQAAGAVPLDLRAMGVDCAAGNGYKWLFAPHGTGYLFVAREHQGAAIDDRSFPGSARHNYPPWTHAPDGDHGDLVFRPRTDARRYETGHQAYLALAAMHAGLRFVEALGVEAIRDHATRLNRQLRDAVGPRYEHISPHADRSPVIAFRAPDARAVVDHLASAGIVVSFQPPDRIRVSPAIYNDEGDVAALADALGTAPRG